MGAEMTMVMELVMELLKLLEKESPLARWYVKDVPDTLMTLRRVEVVVEK